MKILSILTVLFVISKILFAQEDGSDFYELYVSAMENGQIQKAIITGEQWKNDDSTSINAYYFTAKALAKKGRKNDAILNLNQALSLDSMHVPSLLASAQLMKGTNALEIYEKLIIIDPTNAYFNREAAESAVANQKFDKALSYYALAYQNDSLDVITLTGFAQILLDFRRYADADSLLDRVLRIDRNNRFSLLTKAKIAFNAENWEEVLEWLEPLKNDKSYLTAMRYEGISLYHMRRYDKAIEVLRNLSNAMKDLDYPHYYMGLSMEKLGQIEMAEVQYGQALNKALSGNLGTYYERLGLTEQANGKHKEAIETLLMAQKFSERNILNFHLAKSYDVYYQDSAAAMELFERFITREDTLRSPEREYAESRVNQLRKTRHFRGQ